MERSGRYAMVPWGYGSIGSADARYAASAIAALPIGDITLAEIIESAREAIYSPKHR